MLRRTCSFIKNIMMATTSTERVKRCRARKKEAAAKAERRKKQLRESQARCRARKRAQQLLNNMPKADSSTTHPHLQAVQAQRELTTKNSIRTPPPQQQCREWLSTIPSNERATPHGVAEDGDGNTTFTYFLVNDDSWCNEVRLFSFLSCLLLFLLP